MLLLVAVTLGLIASPAEAAPARRLDAHLTELWTTIFETPDARNPFGSGGSAFGCLRLDDAVAPFGPSGIASCTVRPGTKIFVAASSFECSSFEGNGTTDLQLRPCASLGDAQTAPSVTVDGAPAPVTEAETPLLRIVLPKSNIFGQPGGTKGLSVAHGWVTLVRPLAPGSHTIVIHNGANAITTTIIVKCGR